MKKGYVLLLLLFSLSLTMTGKEISPQEAREKALTFLQQRMTGGTTDLNRAPSVINVQPTETGLPSLYAFNAEGGGFVIVSGDDSVDGVLGYSLHGAFDQADMPDNMKAWLQGYARQIKLIQEGKARAARRAPASWERIEPLIKSQWGQRDPYNRECPIDYRYGVRPATGCVATSMSQVIRYWKWPQGATKTVGSDKQVPSTTFDWENMLDTYTEGNYTEAQANAVAHLMRWAGLSVRMDYGVNMSGALTIIIDRALRNYFDYDKNVRWVSQVEYTIDGWEEMLYQELAAKRPVIYNGYNSNIDGHSFICDGYDGEGKFHFNWGWNGNFDGFFQIPALDPVGSGDGGSLSNPSWSDFHDVVIGIQPPTDAPAIETQPDVHDGCERMYVFSEPVMTRPDTKSPFPEIRILRYLTSAHTQSVQSTYRFALLKDGQIHCMLKGRQYADFTKAQLIFINSFNCVLPDTLSDGNYRLVAMMDTGKEPDIKDVLRGSDHFYVNVNIDGTTLRLTEVPGEANLKLTDPEYEYEDVNGEQTVKTLTFTVENLSDEEYFGHLFVYTANVFWSYERCLLRPHETRKVKVVRRKTEYGPVVMKPDEPFGVYADMFYRQWLYGIKIDAQPITLGPLTLSSDRIDNEKKIIKGSNVMSVFTIFNPTDKDHTSLFEIRCFNAEDESNSVTLTTGTKKLPAGSSISFTEKLKNLDEWSKVRFSFRYKNRNDLLDEYFTDAYAVIPVITALTPDSVETIYDDAEAFVTPEDATVAIIPQCKVKHVTPNKNPNTIYYVSDPSVEGLEQSIVLDGSGRIRRPLIFNTRYDMGFKNNLPFIVPDTAGIVHTFAPEETNCWLPLIFYSDVVVDEYVTDAVTGEDLSAMFHYFDQDQETSDCGASSGELRVKPTNQRGQFTLVRVDPAMAGRTVKFIGDGLMNGVYFNVGSKLSVVYNYCRQTRKNVYVVEGDRFVLHDSYEMKPFTFCLEAQEGVTDLPTSLTIVTNDPSGIETVQRSKSEVQSYYDLQGRRVTGKPTQKGVYIYKGKKAVVR